MYIIASDDFIEEGTSNQYFINCIRMLLLAHKEGRHIIAISPPKVKKIIEANIFTDEYKSILENYYFHYCRQAKSLETSFSKVFIIGPSGIGESCYSDIKTKITYYLIHADSIQDSANIQNTIILGENLVDSIIYEIIGIYYLKKINMSKSVEIKYIPQNGGGSTTASVLENIHRKKISFCLGILDSDKKCPNQSFGNTAREVEKYMKRYWHNNYKCQHFIPDSFREIENILPYEFYRIFYDGDVNKAKILSFLDSLNEECRLFFDYKNGIKCKSLQNNNSAQAIFWRYNLCTPYRIDCKIIWVSSFRCDYKIISGYGSNILNDFLIFIKNNDLYKIIDEGSICIKNIWLDIGKHVSSFCCGINRTIAI